MGEQRKSSKDLLLKIKRASISNENSSFCQEQEKELKKLSNPDGGGWRKEIEDAKNAGIAARDLIKKLNWKIYNESLFDPSKGSVWLDLSRQAAEKNCADLLGDKLCDRLRISLIDTCINELISNGAAQAEAITRSKLADAQKIYGPVVLKIQPTPEWVKPIPKIQKGVSHDITSLEPEEAWDIYIDETGKNFSYDEAGKPSQTGHMLAVCIGSSTNMPPLDDFHGMDDLPQNVLGHFNTLLAQSCGIIGFSFSALDIHSEEGWFQTLRKLVSWVWRLLPLPEDGSTVPLRFHVEQRDFFTPKLQNKYGDKFFRTDLIQEDPERAGKFDFSLRYEYKGCPNLAWADVAAFVWGGAVNNNNPLYKDALRISGLEKNCLVTCNSAILDTAEDIFCARLPGASAWVDFVKDQCRSGSGQAPLPSVLYDASMKRLTALCNATPEGTESRWKVYAQAMQDYLDTKQYQPDVLEKMSGFLGQMNCPDPRTRFIWAAAELSNLNHKGAVAAGSEDLRKILAFLDELAPIMANENIEWLVRARTRQAVSDSNAFDFTSALTRLNKWDTAAGGQLTGTAKHDGRILSSIGQYRAFQAYSPASSGISQTIDKAQLAATAKLFGQAVAEFNKLKAIQDLDSVPPLPHEDASRQIRQTGTYQAIVLMDSGAPADEITKTLEMALGTPVAKSLKEAVASPTRDKFAHYLLLRYLVRCTKPDNPLRQAYLKGKDNWLNKDTSFGSSHPWPLIQYFRFLLAADADDKDLISKLPATLAYTAKRDPEPTVDLIVSAIAVSMGRDDPGSAEVHDHLASLEKLMPKAAPIIHAIRAATQGDHTLAARILPFNYC